MVSRTFEIPCGIGYFGWMRDVLEKVQSWITDGEPFALASVVSTWRSAPRAAGAVMAIRHDRLVHGSVSGGCIEGAVIDAAMKVIDNGQPKVLSFGVSNEDAWAVGLSCGGSVKVLLEKHMSFSVNAIEKEIWQKLTSALKSKKEMVVCAKLSGPESAHMLVLRDGSHIGYWNDLDEPVRNLARRAYELKSSLEEDIEGVPVFAHYFGIPPHLVVVGAVHVAIPLIQFAKSMDFETTVIDPRNVFTKLERFERKPDTLSTSWPGAALKEIELDSETYVVLLTHDPKIDDEALGVLLNSSARYIGVLGSKKTQSARLKRLTEAGFTKNQLQRIKGPVGLNINSKSPAEIALSIAAEIVKIKNEPTI